MSNFKRVLSLVLVVLMIVPMFALPTSAAETCSIIINYVYVNGNHAAPQYTATVASGSSFKQTVTSPEVQGYAPDRAEVIFDLESVESDITETVTYSPAEVNYTVNHYQQNIADDKYTLFETETKTGFTESEVGANLAKKYDGFTALLYDTATTIAADGSTVVDIYYDRNYYMLSLDLAGGYGAEPVYARYGAPIEIATPEKPGYTFSGWNPTAPETMPAANTTLTAQWNAGQATYVVQYWQENANDNDYSFVEQKTRTANTGDTVSGSNDKTYAGFTYDYDHAGTNVTVNGDGSTVVNVYYKRNVYEVNFYEYKSSGLFGGSWQVTKTITAKYGAFIGDKWPGNGWYVSKSSSDSTAQSYLSVMPLGGKNFYGQQTGSYTATATYYVEALPGESGTTVSGKTYKEHHKDTAKYDEDFWGGGLSVTDEERYELEGFECNKSISAKNGDNYNGAKFYYTRKSFDLVFDDQYGTQVSEKLPFEQVLSESVNYKNNYVPAYPATLEAGAYSFGGWYADPGCTHAVDWTAKMPAATVVLYAKWTPITHTVRTFLTKDEVATGNPIQTWENIPHRSVINPAPADPENGNYDT